MTCPEAGRKVSGFRRVIGLSPEMRRALDQARRAAEVDSSVLICGEPGTGRRLLAAEIHGNSARRDGPFRVLRTGTVRHDLLDQELFGQAGAVLAGAGSDGAGRLHAAGAGTLFINDVARLGTTTQAKLLRFLETGAATPVDGFSPIRLDVRLVTATAHDLGELVRRGEFRRDLFYRVSVVPISLPPLRQRREDIPPLVRHFLAVISELRRTPPLRPHPELLRLLQSYDWPGNVRQLRQCVERMAATSRQAIISADHLAGAFKGPQGNSVDEQDAMPDQTLASIERDAICQALRRSGGNRSRAARTLGISVRTLQRKLRLWHEQGRLPG